MVSACCSGLDYCARVKHAELGREKHAELGREKHVIYCAREKHAELNGS